MNCPVTQCLCIDTSQSLCVIQYIYVDAKWQGCINVGTLCLWDDSFWAPGVPENLYGAAGHIISERPITPPSEEVRMFKNNLSSFSHAAKKTTFYTHLSISTVYWCKFSLCELLDSKGLFCLISSLLIWRSTAEAAAGVGSHWWASAWPQTDPANSRGRGDHPAMQNQPALSPSI